MNCVTQVAGGLVDLRHVCQVKGREIEDSSKLDVVMKLGNLQRQVGFSQCMTGEIEISGRGLRFAAHIKNRLMMMEPSVHH